MYFKSQAKYLCLYDLLMLRLHSWLIFLPMLYPVCSWIGRPFLRWRLSPGGRSTGGWFGSRMRYAAFLLHHLLAHSPQVESRVSCLVFAAAGSLMRWCVRHIFWYAYRPQSYRLSLCGRSALGDLTSSAVPRKLDRESHQPALSLGFVHFRSSFSA